MPVKIRLQRHGKKGKPFYWIVAADSRAKRDGKYLEKLGTYNPNTNPATIDLDIDGSVKWLQNGAQPTDTARNILSYRGVMMKHHLLGGLRKGALTEEQVEEKFSTWLEQKEGKIADKVSGLDKEKEKEKAEILKAEKAINEQRIADTTEADAPETEEAASEADTQEAEAPAEKAKDEIKEPESKPEVETKKEDAPAKSEENKTEAKPEDKADTTEERKQEDKVEAKSDNSEKSDKEEAKKEDAKTTDKVVDTPEAPQPDKKNAEDNFAAPVEEKEDIKKDDSKKEAPSVQEVISDENFEKKDADKPKPAEDKK